MLILRSEICQIDGERRFLLSRNSFISQPPSLREIIKQRLFTFEWSIAFDFQCKCVGMECAYKKYRTLYQLENVFIRHGEKT